MTKPPSLFVPTQVGVTSFGDFEVEVIDPVADYLAQLKEVFDFNLLRSFVSRSDFRMVYDALHAITGVYAKPILVDELGAPEDALRCVLMFLIVVDPHVSRC